MVTAAMDAAADVGELEELLAELGKRGFLWHGFGVDHNGPEVIAFTYQWDDCADVVIIFDDELAAAYRMPTDDHTDVFRPKQVHWIYSGAPVWTMRALLALPPPCELVAAPMDAPRGLGLPGRNRFPVRMRRRRDAAPGQPSPAAQ